MFSILPYHELTTRFFQQQSSTWQFFAGHSIKLEQVQQYKTELLKNTYKFNAATDEAGLYSKITVAKERLGMQIPVTLYQAEHEEEMNAGIVYLNEEAHIVFSGKLIQLMDDDELLAILSHELSHLHLYRQLNGEVEITDRIIKAIANHPGSTAAHYETARLFQLYTEIFCDRGAYIVTGSYKPIITSLVKLATGLQKVNAESYVQQAEEIFASDAATKTSGLSHPENFIRARAIYLWHAKGSAAEPDIKQMIEGYTGVDELDLHRQTQIESVTKQIIQQLLQPAWMNTPQTMALAKQYFADFDLNVNPAEIKQLSAAIEQLHPSLQEYFAYVLYDFATADKSLEDVPLGYCFSLADELKIDKPFATAVKKERKLTDKKTGLLRKQTVSEYEKQVSEHSLLS